jgi:hypothetical protein
MANDTQIYEYEGKHYQVPKGTTPEEFEAFIGAQQGPTTEAKDFVPPTSPVPKPGVLGRPAMPGVSSHYAGPQSMALTPHGRESRDLPGTLMKEPFKRMALGGEELTGYAPGQKDSEIQKGLHDVITGAGEAVAPVALPVAAAMAPVGTAVGLGLGYLGQKGGYEGTKKLGGSEDTANLVGDVTGLVAGGVGSQIPEAIHQGAMQDPDVAALKALKRGTGKKAISTLEDVTTARPYLKGAENLEDLQGKIPAAKAEIWKPYLDALQKFGHNTVNGPDGPNTVEYYENERLKTSAQLASIREAPVSAQYTAAQKQANIAEIMDRNKAIEAAIDPELQKAGIDPELIRETHGGIKGVQKATEGRSTLTEKKPFGFGKIKDINVTKPATWLGKPLEGIRDIAAGRPLWSGSPTDVNVREGFRTGGDKPNLSPFPPVAQQGPLAFGGPLQPTGPLFQNPASTNPAPVTPQTIGQKFAGRPSAPQPVVPPVGHQFGLGEATPGSLFEHTASVGEKQRPPLPKNITPEVPVGTQSNLLPSPGPLFNAPTEPVGKAGYMTMGQKEGLQKLGYSAQLIKQIPPKVANVLIKNKVTPDRLMKGK